MGCSVSCKQLYPSSAIIQYIFPPQNAVLIPYLHNKSFLCNTYKKIQVLFSVLTFVAEFINFIYSAQALLAENTRF